MRRGRHVRVHPHIENLAENFLKTYFTYQIFLHCLWYIRLLTVLLISKCNIIYSVSKKYSYRFIIFHVLEQKTINIILFQFRSFTNLQAQYFFKNIIDNPIVLNSVSLFLHIIRRWSFIRLLTDQHFILRVWFYFRFDLQFCLR